MKKQLAIAGLLLTALQGCSFFGGSIPQSELDVVCKNPPKTDENKRQIYPVAKKYSNVKFLGQLFTANQCGKQRLSQIPGVSGDYYTAGSTIFIQDVPSAELQKTLQSIGYSCVENNAPCRQFGLNTTVKVADMLKLEPFVAEIREDDCRQCK